MLKSANLGLNIFEGPDNVRRINFVENFELLDKTYGELVKNNSEYVRTTGNANTYLVSKDGLTSYYEGLCLKIKIHVDSTNNCTLNVNNLGAKYIRDSYGNIVKNLKKNIPYHVCYNGSDFILLGKGGGGNATSDKILSGYTATVDDGPITGTMANQGAKIYTPGRSNIAIPEGYHNGQGYIKGDSNLLSKYIQEGKSIFNITGTLKTGVAGFMDLLLKYPIVKIDLSIHDKEIYVNGHKIIYSSNSIELPKSLSFALLTDSRNDSSSHSFVEICAPNSNHKIHIDTYYDVAMELYDNNLLSGYKINNIRNLYMNGYKLACLFDESILDN